MKAAGSAVALASALAACGDAGGVEGSDSADAAGMCVSVTDDLVPPAGATLKFMDPCVLGQDSACETNHCHEFNNKGPHCSAPCAAACECPPPSTGCNGMGYCKAP